ncbi:response regulator transcription factor [Angustibacter sp. McL0619]|uniref:response regulator transcription factor n=1 Tax=Angustibacter sp. McL0619 TaxID=3415676 RepID=UPI003CFB3678
MDDAIEPTVDAGPHVLVVEDDRELSRLLGELLTDEGYQVDLALDGQRGLHLALTRPPDVLVVDRGLPAIEGVELVRRLRRQGVSVPVLILTARGTVRDRIEGLDAGAEDYLVKPFDVDELLARLRSLLRRHSEDADELPIGAGRLLVAQRCVLSPDRERVDLSQRECALLEVLARRPGRVFSREELLERVFEDADTPGSVDTYVYYLRRKLGREAVRTVRGTGYQIGTT